VLNNQGKPLMPCKPSKARKLLKQGKAKVIKREPFTIQLLYGSSGYKQEINLGVDCGSKMIGLSATTKTQELFSAELELRNDIVDLLSTRKQNRRTRRNRLRYRKARFQNRVRSKNKGWLAPSIENKINTHFNIINKLYKMLPISKIIVETAQFDIQKIKIQIYKVKNINKVNNLDFGILGNMCYLEMDISVNIVKENQKTIY
ncbi:MULTISPECIES: RNA-guided endonuclease IscB, partial [unclassified Clostridium]|uniref:RNA-guided endonuclease IscB n=1 Tax=unclassified Clostridium TaxID=2614128 RepID=UPI0025BD6D25